MGLVSVALDLAQSLRRSSHAKAGGDPFAAIPTAVIQSLLHKTDIARAEISLHALELACELKRIIRGTGSTSLVRNQARYLFQKLVINPYFKGRETRVVERKIFVLMPYSESWSDRTYRVLKQTIEGVGFVSQRADDLFNQNVMEDVWSGILSARFFLADITARNPNVFYELGIAHTLGKDVILITQNVADIPFDLQGHRCLVYSGNIDGCEKLKFELSVQLKNRSQM
jgi:hypothetical protein